MGGRSFTGSALRKENTERERILVLTQEQSLVSSRLQPELWGCPKGTLAPDHRPAGAGQGPKPKEKQVGQEHLGPQMTKTPDSGRPFPPASLRAWFLPDSGFHRCLPSKKGSSGLTGLFMRVASYSICLCSTERQPKNLLGRGTVCSAACTGNWKSETRGSTHPLL